MKTVLKNHILRFKDDVRKQPQDILQHSSWPDGTKRNETNEDMDLYIRYVDDEYVICEIIQGRKPRARQKNDDKIPRNREQDTPLDPDYNILSI